MQPFSSDVLEEFVRWMIREVSGILVATFAGTPVVCPRCRRRVLVVPDVFLLLWWVCVVSFRCRGSYCEFVKSQSFSLSSESVELFLLRVKEA